LRDFVFITYCINVEFTVRWPDAAERRDVADMFDRDDPLYGRRDGT
jgi:hypothetical protein